jgi:hypothetical protein
LFYAIAGTDYEIEEKNSTLSNGYYHYNEAVPAKDASGSIFEAVTVTANREGPDGYKKLHVKILAEAIQTVPADAVKNAWGVTFDTDTGEWKKVTP